MYPTIEYFADAVDSIVNDPARKPQFVAEVRTKLIWALKEESFLMDCLRLSFLHFFSPAETSPEKKQTIYTSPAGYSVRIIYWPAGFENEPHTHDFWTVTGVVHNTLKFYTYKAESTGESTPALVIDKNISARQGEAGFIIPPCIHNVANDSKDVSVSIHLFSLSPMDEMQQETRFRTEEHVHHNKPGEDTNPLQGAKKRLLMTNLKILCDFREKSDALQSLIAAHWDKSPHALQLECIPFILNYDQAFAITKINELSLNVEEPLRSKLLNISEKVTEMINSNKQL